MASTSGKDTIKTPLVEIDKLIQSLMKSGDKAGVTVTAAQFEKNFKKGGLVTVSFGLLEKLIAVYGVLGKALAQSDIAASKKENTLLQKDVTSLKDRRDNQVLIDGVKNNTINRLSEEVKQGVKYSKVNCTQWPYKKRGVRLPPIMQGKPERAGSVYQGRY